MKKVLSLLLIVCMALALCAPALAANEGAERVVLGADLNDSQILDVYGQFGIVRGSVPELKVTNAEERSYLQGLVSENIIGTRSISCIYIKLLGEGEGLTVSASNITWCTEDMYRSALMTAGIYDAQVKVGAPFAVSGTAALTGVYKAYEDITGVKLDEDAKAAAADELVITAELADALTEAIGSENVDPAIIAELANSEDANAVADAIADADAVAIVNELKLILNETQNMTDAELRVQIINIANEYGYTLDDALIDRLISMCRSMEGLSISELQEKVEDFKSGVEKMRTTVQTMQEYAEKAATFGEKVSNFFRSIGDFFSRLFGGKN